jgi:hypothetical protein
MIGQQNRVQPFDVNDHPKLLKLKVAYTLDNPCTTWERQQLFDLIVGTLYDMATSQPVEYKEWVELEKLVINSRLTVGEWLQKYKQPEQGVA